MKGYLTENENVEVRFLTWLAPVHTSFITSFHPAGLVAKGEPKQEGYLVNNPFLHSLARLSSFF